MQCQAALRLSVIVGTERSLEKTEPVAKRRQRAAKGIRDSTLEPAHPARADSAQHYSFAPGGCECLVHRLNAPHCQHVRSVAAADVNHILAAQKLRQIGQT